MTVMRRYKNHAVGFALFLLLVLATGCSDPDKSTNPTLVPPTVISEVPLAGAVLVCPSAVVTATFSVAMNSSSITAATFILTGPGATPVTGAVTYNATSKTATFTPSSALALSTLYTATITTGAIDQYGIALASNFVWTFTTAAEPCAPPTVLSVTPLAGAVGICPSTVVTATFSEAMNPATVNTTTFTLTAGTPPVAVTGVITADPTNKIYTFTPSSPLALDTLYTATVTTGAQNLNGTALASNFVWTFTTSIEPCAPPTVISVTPANGVCPSTVVTATFSEAMNPATINATTFTLTGPGTTPVTGVVTYAASTATFTPSSPLALSTLYTATITTGAQNLNGNALASNYVWTFTTSATTCAPPTVISVAPPNLAVDICPGTLVVATFSEAMNPATINATTFTLTASGTPVAGTVTYVVSSYVATFTPTNPLALDTLYTATITTGAQNLAGIGLATDYVWTFTTAATACAGTVPLGTACMFGILAATPAVTSSGPTNVTGDIGIYPAASIVGFPPGTLTGTEYAGDAVAATAQGDLTTAYNYAAAAAGGAVLPADIGGETLVPGVYKTTSAQPSLGITGNLTLSGNGVYIFQIVSTLTTAANNSDVILSGGATSEDVFWQVGSSATLGTTTIFAGTIMAQASVSVDTGATLNGRALARTGAVTLLSNPVNVPPCP
jgi:hypothetical protein